MSINMSIMQTAMGEATEEEAIRFIEFMENRGYEIDTDYGSVSISHEGEEIDYENDWLPLLRECFRA